MAAIRLTILASLATAVINGVLGTLIAYVLVRFRFPGRGVLAGGGAAAAAAGGEHERPGEEGKAQLHGREG